MAGDNPTDEVVGGEEETGKAVNEAKRGRLIPHVA